MSTVFPCFFFFFFNFFVLEAGHSTIANPTFLSILQVCCFHYVWKDVSLNIRIRLVPWCSTLHLCLHFNATFQSCLWFFFFYAEVSCSHCTSFDIKWSNRSEVFCTKDGLGNFAEFTGKHLCLRPATLSKKRLWHRCIPVNFAKFLRTPLVAASGY